MEDRDIVALYLRRDEGAIKCTAEKYGSRLRALALGITGDRQSAEECENDAYLAAWSSIPPKRPEDHFFPFLARIVRDQALNLCRGRTAQKRSARVEELSRELEQCLPFVFGCSSTLPEPAPDATDERLLLRSTILSAANKIYLDCCFDALRQEQNLWADILPDLA